jgi:molybdopterin molybdotransferase
MPEFLTLLPPARALDRLFQHGFQSPRAERIETALAAGRVTAEAIIAPEALPAFSRSTVDGYAVQAASTYGASEGLPAYLDLAGEAPMGAAPSFQVEAGQAGLIHTGGMLPDGADAVVMLEQAQPLGAAGIEVLKAVAPGENVLLAGEDVAAGDVVIAAGKRLRAAEVGGLAALGITSLRVATPPRVGILSTGDELVSPETMPKPGQVRDINSYTLSTLVSGWGGEPRRYGILPDRREALNDGVSRALAECDLVIITAGSSASSRDLTAEVIQSQGAPGVLVHGVNVRPGKPTILAMCAGKPVIGLPGNPVSAVVIASLFVRPVIAHLLGMPREALQAGATARLTINLASQAGREDWVPVRLSARADGLWAEPVFFKSNLIFNLVGADGLAYIPADATGVSAGGAVQVNLL